MPGTAKRKCEPSASVASLSSGVHEQKAADDSIQPLGGNSITAFPWLSFAGRQLDATFMRNNDKCILGMTSELLSQCLMLVIQLLSLVSSLLLKY